MKSICFNDAIKQKTDSVWARTLRNHFIARQQLSLHCKYDARNVHKDGGGNSLHMWFHFQTYHFFQFMGHLLFSQQFEHAKILMTSSNQNQKHSFLMNAISIQIIKIIFKFSWLNISAVHKKILILTF